MVEKPKGAHNSLACFAGSMISALISDIASGRPHLKSSLENDLATILSGIEHEGIQYCTITLPSLYKAIYRSFATGKLETPTCFSRLKGTALPKLFSGLLKDVYSDDGSLLPNACIASITEVVQLTALGYKLDVPCKKERIDAVLDDFKKTELELAGLTEEIDQIQEFSNMNFLDHRDLPLGVYHSAKILGLATHAIRDIFSDYEWRGKLIPAFDWRDILPKHGPGAVATGERRREKWQFKRKYSAIHAIYPYYEYFVSCRKDLLDSISWYRNLEQHTSGQAKVVLVPKDSRGPRIISMEPLEYQFIQQGLWRSLKRRFETHPLTRHRVNFENQSMNQVHALVGSIDGTWATLDMKEASDRVSVALVKALFRDAPEVLKALLACRTTSTKLPDGTVLDLHKFAPMGSALCFPIESIVHYVLAVCCIQHTSIENGIWLSFEKASKLVCVYGDDIIIHRDYADTVMKIFPHFGLKFNEDKCFIHGPFRESCGVDAFKGHPITPIKWRKPWLQRPDAVTIQSACELASLFYQRGYLQAANMVWENVESFVGKLPTTDLRMEVGYLTRRSRFPYLHTPYPVRKDLNLQLLEHRALSLKNRTEDNPWDTWSRFFENQVLGAPSTRKRDKSGCVKESTPFSKLKREWTALFG